MTLIGSVKTGIGSEPTAGGGGDDGGGGGAAGVPFTITLPNSVNAEVTALEIDTRLFNATSGQESSAVTIQAILGGAPIQERIDLLNATGRQTTATVADGATITWNTRADLLVVTLGVVTTSIIVQPLNLNADFQYEVCWFSNGVVAAAGITVLRLNQTVNSAQGIQRFQQQGAGVSAAASVVAAILVDNPAAGTLAFSRATITGPPNMPKAIQVQQQYQQPAGTNWLEDDVVLFTPTGQVANLSLNGKMNAGDVLTFRTTRAVAS